MKIAPVLWVAGDGVQHAPVHHAFRDPPVTLRNDAFTALLDPKADQPRGATIRKTGDNWLDKPNRPIRRTQQQSARIRGDLASPHHASSISQSMPGRPVLAVQFERIGGSASRQ